jgi:hypothetical protein
MSQVKITSRATKAGSPTRILMADSIKAEERIISLPGMAEGEATLTNKIGFTERKERGLLPTPTFPLISRRLVIRG